MTDGAQRALNFRERAKELRAIADKLQDEEQQKRLRDVADEYEKMTEKHLGM